VGISRRLPAEDGVVLRLGGAKDVGRERVPLHRIPRSRRRGGDGGQRRRHARVAVAELGLAFRAGERGGHRVTDAPLRLVDPNADHGVKHEHVERLDRAHQLVRVAEHAPAAGALDDERGVHLPEGSFEYLARKKKNEFVVC